MATHIETTTRAAALAIIAEIDRAEGYPKLPTAPGGGDSARTQACRDWIAGDQVGDPPPGIGLSHDEPAEHPEEAGRYSVRVDGVERHVVGKTVDGAGRIDAEDVVTRDSTWAEGKATATVRVR